MRTPDWRQTLVWTVIALAGARASATGVAWFQLTPDCPVAPGELVAGDGEEPQVVPCGGAGSFVFGKPGLQYDGGCGLLGKGTEAPSLLPVEPAPRLPASFPCARGSCLGRSPGQPWVAVVDWPTAHGWSVAATVLEAADRRVGVELYDLTAAGELGQWVPPVSDLHVLVQLCALAQAAEKDPGDRPLAVNLSFGRRTAQTDGAPGSSLGGAVGRVLSHLARVEGILPVAAAGNHHELLFPASSPGVVSAGALDLARLQRGQEPSPSTQTPPTAEALMLGYGIDLPLSDGDSTWPAPPGSSYAAAVFTGWLGGTLAGGGSLPGPVAEGARWTPVFTAVGGVALALDGVPLAGSELTGPRLLLERALAVPSSRQPEVGAVVRLTGPAPTLPETSVLHADNGNGPLPGVDPCVPCHGDGLQGGAPESLESVLVDLSSSGALPPQMELVAVLLRVGKAVYAFDGSRDPDLLAQIAAGGLAGLTLSEVEGVFQPGEQPSLVLVVNVGGLAYWHEVPLLLHS